MARKSLANVDPELESVVEGFTSLPEMCLEMALDVYGAQDEKTQAVIDRVIATLQNYATGYMASKVSRTAVPVKIDADDLGYNLLYLAVEIMKDLAFMGIRVANFEFPEQICASCGTELSAANVRRVGKRKNG